MHPIKKLIDLRDSAGSFGKLLTALAGVVAQAVQLGVVPTADQKYAALGISVLTAIAVYFIPNSTPTPPVAVPPAPGS